MVAGERRLFRTPVISRDAFPPKDRQRHRAPKLAFMSQTAAQQPDGQGHKGQHNGQKGAPTQFVNNGGQKGVAVAAWYRHFKGLGGNVGIPDPLSQPPGDVQHLSDVAGQVS